MSVEPKRLAAAFFLPRGERDLTLEELLRAAGVTPSAAGRPTPDYDPSGLIDCLWAGLTCRAGVFNLEYHQLFVIYFWQSSFLEMLGGPSDADSLVAAFRDACEALAPEVAFIVTHLDQADIDWILDREAAVLSKDANLLAGERVGLLYLNEEVSSYWTPNPVRDDRDSVPVASGRMVFAGRGDFSRWF